MCKLVIRSTIRCPALCLITRSPVVGCTISIWYRKAFDKVQLVGQTSNNHILTDILAGVDWISHHYIIIIISRVYVKWFAIYLVNVCIVHKI